jgi:hypothetical protein
VITPQASKQTNQEGDDFDPEGGDFAGVRDITPRCCFPTSVNSLLINSTFVCASFVCVHHPYWRCSILSVAMDFDTRHTPAAVQSTKREKSCKLNNEEK